MSVTLHAVFVATIPNCATDATCERQTVGRRREGTLPPIEKTEICDDRGSATLRISLQEKNTIIIFIEYSFAI